MSDVKKFMPIDWKLHGRRFKHQNANNKQIPQPGMSQNVGDALATASRKTGAQYDYLVKTASRESAFNPNAKARTSSAAGLFQFIESTWLQVMKEQGASIGLGHYSKYIQKTSNGYDVANPQHRKSILDLRYNPTIASKMAGALTTRNNEILRQNIGRNPTNGELYIAHFLGPEGASKLIKRAWSNPDTPAANLFPAAAKANKPIFYTKGRPRSVTEVYHQLSRSFDTIASGQPIAEKALNHNNSIAPSQQIPIEPSKIFQGLFFEAAEQQRTKRSSQDDFSLKTAETALPSTSVGQNIQNQLPLSLFTGTSAKGDVDAKSVSQAYENHAVKPNLNKSFFTLLR